MECGPAQAAELSLPPPNKPSCVCVRPSCMPPPPPLPGPPPQALLGVCETELEDLRKQLSSSRERDNFRAAYRHHTTDRHMSLALRAQSWPMDMLTTSDRYLRGGAG